MDLYPYHYLRRSHGEELTMESSVYSTLRQVLDEMQKMESRLGDCIEGRCDGLERRVAEAEQRSKECFISLEMARAEVEQGHTALEKQFDGLRLEVHRMNRLLEHDNLANQQDKPGIFSTSAYGSGAKMPGVELEVPQMLGSGASHGKSTSQGLAGDGELHQSVSTGFHSESSQAGQGRLPKMNFLVFSGEDPQLWKSRCENYFDMYGVENSLWIRVATMHLEGAAARSLQSVEKRLQTASWDELCSLLHDHFGRDQHEALIYELFHIHQVSSVVDYVEWFSVLVDQLAAYAPAESSLHYAMKFIDGLHDDIMPVVMIQHPAMLDSAYALALVQEEAMRSH
jgi:hypothetical protein